MGRPMIPASDPSVAVVCLEKKRSRRATLSAMDSLSTDARTEFYRIARTARSLFVALCATCPDPCDGNRMICSVSSRDWILNGQDAIEAVHAAWSLFAVTPVEAAGGGGEAGDDGRRD